MFNLMSNFSGSLQDANLILFIATAATQTSKHVGVNVESDLEVASNLHTFAMS